MAYNAPTSEIHKTDAIIAKFMGYKLITPEMRKCRVDWQYAYWEREDDLGNGNKVLGAENKLRYSFSWDALMPVVRQIVSLCLEDINGELFASDQYTSVLETLPMAVIDDAYKVILEFIEYYNNFKN